MHAPTISHSQRNYGLDRLRVVSALLRCILHTAVPYMVVRTGMWPLKEANNTNLLPDAWVFVAHSFIMEAFFFISGYVMCVQVAAYQKEAFIRNRLRKVFLPFAVILFTLIPYVIFLFSPGKEIEAGHLTWDWAQWCTDLLTNISGHLYPIGHLWFLWYLLLYYLLLWATPANWLRTATYWTDRLFGAGNFWRGFGVLWAITIACLWFSTAWYILNPLTTTPEGSSFFYFLTFLLLGMYAVQNSLLLTKIGAHKWQMVIGFGICSVLALVFQSFSKQVTHPYYTALHAGAVITSSLQTCFGVFGSIGLFQGYQQPPGRVLRFLIRSTYWVYLVHLPIVITLHVLLFPLAIPLFLKFSIALLGSLGIAFALYPVIGKKITQT